MRIKLFIVIATLAAPLFALAGYKLELRDQWNPRTGGLLLNALGGTTVGNGGLGVARGSGVLLLDFADRSTSIDDLWVGEAIDADFLRPEDQALFRSFGLPDGLLERKLTDINRRAFPLGRYLRDAISAFRWSLTNEALRHTPDAPGGETFLQIAARTQDEIVIHAPYWKAMSDKHKLGLIIHEALYALMLPPCNPEILTFKNPSCLPQPSYAEKARMWVSLFFTKTEETTKEIDLFPLLAVPRKLSLGGNRIELRSSTGPSLHSPSTEISVRKALVEEFCAAQSFPLVTQVYAQRKPYEVLRAIKPAYGQLMIRARSGTLVENIETRSLEECRQKLENVLEKWFPKVRVLSTLPYFYN